MLVLCFSTKMADITVYEVKSGSIKKTAKLVIKNFVEAISTFKPGKSIDSVPFMVGDTAMTIKVYPNGSSTEHRGNVSIYLGSKSNTEMNAKCQFITDVATKEFGYEDMMMAKKSYGFSVFVTHAECLEVYADKDFAVTAKVEIPGEVAMLAGKLPKKRKFNVLENVYKKMQRTDFTLVQTCKKQPIFGSSTKSFG